MKTWVKYGAATMGLLLYQRLLLVLNEKRRVLQRHKSHVYKKERQRWNGQVSDHWMLMKI